MIKLFIQIMFWEFILLSIIFIGYNIAKFICYIVDIIFKYKIYSSIIFLTILLSFIFYKIDYIIICFISVILFHIILIKIYTYKKSIQCVNNNIEYKLIKLCKKNIYKKYNNYNILSFMEEYNFESKELYIKHILENLIPLLKDIAKEQLNFSMAFNSILLSIFSIYIALFSFMSSKNINDSYSLAFIILFILIVIFNILFRLKYFLSKLDTKSYIKIYNFENYLKNELKKCSYN